MGGDCRRRKMQKLFSSQKDTVPTAREIKTATAQGVIGLHITADRVWAEVLDRASSSVMFLVKKMKNFKFNNY